MIKDEDRVDQGLDLESSRHAVSTRISQRRMVMTSCR